MYKSVKTCIKSKWVINTIFRLLHGGQIGGTLSSLLFILYINDMSTSLSDGIVETISIDELQMFWLLFADDTVLFSYTQGLHF